MVKLFDFDFETGFQTAYWTKKRGD